MGSGFNNIYPKENAELFNQIIEKGGLVISEYSPDTKPDSKHFPVRNRIITGLSLGVLVIEAGYRSGASLTAHIAIKEGKKVFCIPSNIDSKYVRTNELIQEGAILVNDINDIFNGLNINCRGGFPYPPEIKTTINIPSGYKKIYNLLSKEPVHMNYICKKLNTDIAEISSTLMMMELEGFIEQLPGKVFKHVL